MASEKITAIVESVKTMTVLELKELVDTICEEFGVSAVAAAAPAAAALPQTGANWLAVVGTALSGLFLLAAGFVLDRKNRRMN